MPFKNSISGERALGTAGGRVAGRAVCAAACLGDKGFCAFLTP
jgi:hypothetical protein